MELSTLIEGILRRFAPQNDSFSRYISLS